MKEATAFMKDPKSILEKYFQNLTKPVRKISGPIPESSRVFPIENLREDNEMKNEYKTRPLKVIMDFWL
jgi:hypothetical protein